MDLMNLENNQAEQSGAIVLNGDTQKIIFENEQVCTF